MYPTGSNLPTTAEKNNAETSREKECWLKWSPNNIN
jgi:hypothetical protein